MLVVEAIIAVGVLVVPMAGAARMIDVAQKIHGQVDDSSNKEHGAERWEQAAGAPQLTAMDGVHKGNALPVRALARGGGNRGDHVNTSTRVCPLHGLLVGCARHACDRNDQSRPWTLGGNRVTLNLGLGAARQHDLG